MLGRLEAALDRAAQATAEKRRWRGAGTARSSLPAGWRAEDVLGLGRRAEFFPVDEAARRMGLPVEDLVGLAAAGWLDAVVRSGELYVLPVVLSRLGVGDARAPVEHEGGTVPTGSESTDDVLALVEFGTKR